jgi:hypothetical protein
MTSRRCLAASSAPPDRLNGQKPEEREERATGQAASLAKVERSIYREAINPLTINYEWEGRHGYSYNLAPEHRVMYLGYRRQNDEK